MSKNTLFLIIGLVLLPFSILLIIAENYQASAQTYTTLSEYENRQMGITFEYPNNLSIMSLSCFESDVSGCGIALLFDNMLLTCDECEKGVYAGGVIALKLNESFQNEKACNCDTLLDFVRWDYDRMSYAKVKLIKEIRTVVGINHLAWQMEISEEQDKKRQLIVWAINNNLGYIFTYSYTDLGNHEYSKYLPVFKDILKSVKFTQISLH